MTVGIGLIGLAPIGFISLIMFGLAFAAGKPQPINSEGGDTPVDHGACGDDGGDCGGG